MRVDVGVYNEATGFTIHAANFAGRARDDVIRNLYQNVQDGIVIPVQLVQDGCPHVRLVIGERLSEKEEAEWVGRFVWKLRVPCGTLVFEGGFDPRGPRKDFQKSVTIPPGDYQVEFYTFYWGINGFDYLPKDLSEPVGAWYRRTCPGQSFPATMKFYLQEFSEDDPGHEEEWVESCYSDEGEELEEPEYIDFLVRLTPMESEQPALQLQCDEAGWFPLGINPRKPELCPTGISFQRLR